MTLQDRKELEDRQEDREPERRETIWRSQTAAYTVGADTLWVDTDTITDQGLSIEEAINQQYLRGIPAKVTLRNRTAWPLTLDSSYDDLQQILHVELIKQGEPQLPAPAAVAAWLRYERHMLRRGQTTSTIKSLLTLLTVALVVALSAIGLMGILP